MKLIFVFFHFIFAILNFAFLVLIVIPVMYELIKVVFN